MILPEKKGKNIKKIEREIDESKLGPGKYKIRRKIVEPRQDKGTVGIPQVTRSKDRQRKIDKYMIKEVPEGIIFPNYDYDKPEKLVFKYYEPTEHQP